MKLPISTFFTLLVIAFAGSSRAQGEEDRNLQAEDVFHSFLSAFTDSDVDGIVNLFSEDAIFWGTGTPLHSTPLRISMALSLQDGIWKIVQFHNSAMPGS